MDVELNLGDIKQSSGQDAFAKIGAFAALIFCPVWIEGMQRGFDGAKIVFSTRSVLSGPLKADVFFLTPPIPVLKSQDPYIELLDFKSGEKSLRYWCGRMALFDVILERDAYQYQTWNAGDRDTRGFRQLLEKFLARFPKGAFSSEARSRLAQLPKVELRPKVGKFFKDCDDCPEMVEIPSGSYVMGSPIDEIDRTTRHDAEQRVVRIGRSFALGRTHVTRKQFADFVTASGHDTGDRCEIVIEGKGWTSMRGATWQSPGFVQTDSHSVVCVNRKDAEAYARWLSVKAGRTYHLPDEEQLEYAIRGGAVGARWWGEGSSADACNYANVRDHNGKSGIAHIHDCNDGFAHTSPVGSFAMNGFGLFDAIGNASQFAVGCASLGASVSKPPQGTQEGTECSHIWSLGGSWGAGPLYSRSAVRLKRNAEDRDFFTGFRIARTLP